MLPLDELQPIDKWILARTDRLVKTVRDAFDSYSFHVVSHEMVNFCTLDLSKLYIDITKDRLYVEKSDSAARRSAQTAMYLVLSAITKLLAPILAFTADEIWQSMPHAADENGEHVLLNDMPEALETPRFAELEERYNKLFTLRDDVMKALELARADKKIGKSLEAKVTVYADGEQAELLRSFESELPTVFIVSGAKVSEESAPAEAFAETETGIKVLVEAADGCKCDRCWGFFTEGEQQSEGFLCKRCAAIVKELMA